MDKRSQHIIQKVQAELTIPNTERNHEKSEQLKRAMQQAVQNVEPELNEAAGASLVRIDTLSVELTIRNSDLDRLEELIEKAVREKIVETIQQESGLDENSKPDLELVSSDESYREILSTFLKTGRLPWWIETKDLTEVERWLTELSAKEWISFIKPLARSNPSVFRRIVAQFSVSVVQEIVQKTVAELSDDSEVIRLLEVILQFLRSRDIPRSVYSRIQSDLHFKIIENVLAGVSQKELADELVVSALKILIQSTVDKTKPGSVAKALERWFERSEAPQAELWISRLESLSIDRDWVDDTVEAGRFKQKENLQKSNPEADKPNEEQGLSAVHAGVVILHPFLETLFKNLGYVEGGEFLNDAAQERAVCLLHYLATGMEEFPEYELSLPKFLCGWPFNSPINRFLSLTESEKNECESLLSNCIQHWEALKNTSMDGLRENFLRREGILKREEFGWSLYVEQRTRDILLDRLPWNLSIVKLKWMDEMLTVHWV